MNKGEEICIHTVFYNYIITFTGSFHFFHEDLSWSGVTCFQPEELSLVFLIRKIC